MFPNSKIFKQAYEITRNHKFLWIFGLLLTLGNTVFIRDEESMPQVPTSYAWLIIFLVLVFLVIYFRSKVSMIIGIKAVLDKQETGANLSFKVSRLFYIRVLLVYLLTEIALLVFGSIIAIPIVSMFERGQLSTAIPFLIVGLFIFIPFAVTIALINVLAPMYVVLYDLKPKEAIKSSVDLFSKYWFPLSSLALLLFLPQLAILLLSIPIVFLSDLPYHMVGFISMIVGLLVLWIAHAIIAVFTQSVWVLVFLDYVKPQKFEVTEPVVMPEIAS